jgi:hypothetical protein
MIIGLCLTLAIFLGTAAIFFPPALEDESYYGDL